MVDGSDGRNGSLICKSVHAVARAHLAAFGRVAPGQGIGGRFIAGMPPSCRCSRDMPRGQGCFNARKNTLIVQNRDAMSNGDMLGPPWRRSAVGLTPI